MSEFIVRVEHLGKRYHIWHQAQRPPYVALRDVITHRIADAARSVLSSVGRRSDGDGLPSQTEDFWALTDHAFGEHVISHDYRRDRPDHLILHEVWPQVQA